MTIEATPTASAATNQLVRIDTSLVFSVVASDQISRVSELLHEAAETHHAVYRITDGDDPDWASWYADWLLGLSELPDVLGTRPVRSQLVHALVESRRVPVLESLRTLRRRVLAVELVERFGA
jgi:hypothetical protein